MFLNLLTDLQPDTLPMQHDGVYALMSWRDLDLAKQQNNSGHEGWLLLLVFALWLPLLFFGLATSAAADNVPVASHPLVAGTVVAMADISQSQVAPNKLYNSTPRTADEIIGKRLSRAVREGDAFNSFTLKAPNTIERNSAVTMLFKRPGIELSSQGVALESGSEGKTIRVLNPENRTTLVATISGPGTVTVGDQ